MSWRLNEKYELLLKINNAIIKEYTRDGLFRKIATELKQLFHYDRCSINIYDSGTKSLSYFATAEGIKPEGITCETKRPLPLGSVANLVIKSQKPVIIKDLREHPEISTADSMLSKGLMSTMAFPLIIRDKFLGSFHVAFQKCPPNIEELSNFLSELSVQIAIAVDNMMSYYKLQKLYEKLEEQKEYVLQKSTNEYKEFFFMSKIMSKVIKNAELIATSDSSVLITGETGTGKDHLARYIHSLSSRSKQLFVKVNCAALAPTLIESELFGHAKGAFTGAISRRVGRFEMASGGTVFLDEIGELPPQCQSKLLQVLEEKTFERVGESVPITADFRVISATNQDLKTKVRGKEFRRDLYYRLNTIHLHIPPLKERIEDIPLLVISFTTRLAQKWHKPEARYSSGAMRVLCDYQWPGNVRELQNLVERIMILRAGYTIQKADVYDLLYSLESDKEISESEEDKFLTRQEMEKRHIEEALEYCHGIVGGPHGAAQLLGMPRTTLQYRMKKLGINPRKYSTNVTTSQPN